MDGATVRGVAPGHRDHQEEDGEPRRSGRRGNPKSRFRNRVGEVDAPGQSNQLGSVTRCLE